MTKQEFKRDFITNYLKTNDLPFNRQLWNDSLDYCIKEGLKVNPEWIKTPHIFYGEKQYRE